MLPETRGKLMSGTAYRCARVLGAIATIMIFAVTGAQAQQTPDYEAIVASPDRADGDRQADQRRQPAKMLAFTGVKTGMKVLDMEASAGYSTELLARAVGPTGIVYAQDSAAVIERSSRTSSTSAPRSR